MSTPWCRSGNYCHHWAKFCGILQGGGNIIKGKNCHRPECDAKLQRKPTRVSNLRKNSSWSGMRAPWNPKGIPELENFGWMTIFHFQCFNENSVHKTKLRDSNVASLSPCVVATLHSIITQQHYTRKHNAPALNSVEFLHSAKLSDITQRHTQRQVMISHRQIKQARENTRKCWTSR